jgi:hypothetical protein
LLPKGWTTPCVNDDNMSRRSDASMERYAQRDKPNASVAREVKLIQSSWPTPSTIEPDGPPRPSRAATGRTTEYLGRTAQLASWPTPTAQDNDQVAGEYATNGTTLGGASRLTSWATPTSRDHKDGSSIGTAPENALLGRQVWQTHGQTLPGSPAETAKPGQLNPAFSLWLMGYPTAWERCAVQVTPSSRKSPRRSSAPTSTSKP